MTPFLILFSNNFFLAIWIEIATASKFKWSIFLVRPIHPDSLFYENCVSDKFICKTRTLLEITPAALGRCAIRVYEFLKNLPLVVNDTILSIFCGISINRQKLFQWVGCSIYAGSGFHCSSALRMLYVVFWELVFDEHNGRTIQINFGQKWVMVYFSKAK